MKVLLINSPSRRGAGGLELPMGLLYAASVVEMEGHRAKIYDPYVADIEFKDFDSGRFELIGKVIEDFSPQIIGYGGIATSYGRTKALSKFVKNKYPDILQIAGGALSSLYELLLTSAEIDVVFHGEAESGLRAFLERIDAKRDFRDLAGISYIHQGGIIKNAPAGQVDLDEMPLPAYHLLDVRRYFKSAKSKLDFYSLLIEGDPIYADIKKRIEGREFYFPIVTARGCTHRCSFCYRHMTGVRQHSVDYVIRHMKYLKDTYGLSGFSFADELFNSRPEWVYALCDRIEKENLDIFYIVAGARVDKMDERMLRRLKETGCVSIEYGQESGSDKILREYRKGVSKELNKEITLLTTKKMGILSVVQLVIGSPGETPQTIGETIQFLKDLDAYSYSINYLIPLPGAPIWDYVQARGLVGDVEEYLDTVAENAGRAIINLTNFPDAVWRRWASLIHKEMRLYYYRKKKARLYPLYALTQNARSAVLPFVPSGAKRFLSKLVRR